MVAQGGSQEYHLQFEYNTISIQAQAHEWLQGILFQDQYKIETNHRKNLINITRNAIKPIQL